MSEPTQSEIPIPESAIRAAAKVAWAGQIPNADWSELSAGLQRLWLANQRAAIDAFLLEMQFKVERRAEYAKGRLTLPLGSSAAPGPDWKMTYQEQRLVSEWQPVEQTQPSERAKSNHADEGPYLANKGWPR